MEDDKSLSDYGLTSTVAKAQQPAEVIMIAIIMRMNVMIMVMIFVQSKFGGLLKTHLFKIGLAFRDICVFLGVIFLPLQLRSRIFLWRILGVFCSKISCMLAGRLGLPGRGRQLWMGGAREDAVQVIRKTIQVPKKRVEK